MAEKKIDKKRAERFVWKLDDIVFESDKKEEKKLNEKLKKNNKN